MKRKHEEKLNELNRKHEDERRKIRDGPLTHIDRKVGEPENHIH